MTQIIRRVIREETDFVPAGNVVCPHCKGKALLSKYDEGWRSIVHDENLAAMRPCYRCAGRGYVPKEDE